MEFPELGQHCSRSSCRQLDFLPVKCDACNQIFCRTHMKYISHNCPSVYKKNVQVPVCPLCNKPVPTPRGVAPDVSVGNHIDNDCRSDSAENRRKVFTNKCSLKKCNVKEMIRIICENCKQNFCLKHRHPVDHQCTRNQSSRNKVNHGGIFGFMGNLNSSHSQTSTNQRSAESNNYRQNQIDEDESLARAIALSEEEYTQTSRDVRPKTSCALS